MNSDLYFIGIDGGGTKCRVILQDKSGTQIGEGISGPANIMRDETLAKASIMDGVEKAITSANTLLASQNSDAPVTPITLSQCVVAAGLAGANISTAKARFETWAHPFHSLHILSDLHAACVGAHNGKPGAVIIVGTGSAGTVFNEGKFTDLGGHGFPVGDFASGAWLGLKAIQHTLLCIDNIRSKDELAKTVCVELGTTNADDIVAKCAGFNTHHYASLVPCMLPLLNEGNSQVTCIFKEGAEYLETMAQRLLGDNGYNLALIGGLSDVYVPFFSEKTRARLQACELSPQQGAIKYAQAFYDDL
ncbi:BadF/BadG/BcrA/BcrD ATPase family protein [Alteromonas sp. PRIM-21]|uniref:BadF/BadG/BcrA/BcrD ATPase family protein n=1 Tax=Alteromonas sp. PRIM-21 TaxID=1454978 RepID=UPI0022B9A8A9|nr:BadF/BadG/BcrA/BcrD ATPase family protein [Alteromonas sp. PRIM-21]MCZ8529051.1 ATPase [Alteromonas sp. PRIM-21]